MNYLIIDLNSLKMYPTDHLEMNFMGKQCTEKVLSMISTMEGMLENIPMFYVNGGTVNNYFSNPSVSRPLHSSEEHIKEILLALLNATNEEGHRIFTEKSQWYAVYKVLSEYHGYPNNMREFCDIMKNLGMDDVTPACVYESLRKVPNQVSFPTNKVTLWHNYKDKAEPKFKKQIIVAMKLMEMLEE